MITSNLKSKLLIAVKENINVFTYTVNGEVKYRKPASVEARHKTPSSINVSSNKLKVSLMLDNTDVGKIQDIKLLDHDGQVLFETNAVYYKEDEIGIYISFEISDIVEVI